MNAQRCIQRLSSASKRLSSPSKMLVLGPTFSGSFPSLTRLIAADHEDNEYEVRAGSVSNSDYARTMLEILRKAKEALTQIGKESPINARRVQPYGI